MQPKSVSYSIFLVIELIRLSMIVSAASTSTDIRTSLAWYASLPALCIAPALWLMLAMDEARFTLWLPLLAMIKALTLVSLIAFAFRALPEALRFGITGSHTAAALPIAGLFAIADCALGIYAFRRSRALCK